MSRLNGYTAVHRYDGAVIERDEREQVIPIAVQPRDLAIVRDVWRYRLPEPPRDQSVFRARAT